MSCHKEKKRKQQKQRLPAMVIHACYASSCEAEAGGSLQAQGPAGIHRVPGWLGLHSEILSQNETKQN